MTNIFNSFFSRGPRRENDLGISISLTERGDSEPRSASRISHIKIGHSLSDLGDDDYQHDLMTMQSSTNIVSVLNTPRRSTFLGDVYDIFQETVVDPALDSITSQKTPVIDQEILNVKFEDFKDYIQKISKVLETYKKNNVIKSARQREKQLINISESLMRCYNVVKPNFFDQKYIFDFSYLTRNMRQLKATQEELTEYLDHIELNLFYQITSRFHDIMDVILNLNEMEIQVENCLKTIEFHKHFNNDMKEKAYLHSLKILHMKRRQINIQKTLQLLELVSVLRQIVPTLKQLVKNANYDYAVVLIKNSEETYKKKLKDLSCLTNVQRIFADARSTLEKNLNTEFVDRCFNYAVSTLVYNKNPNTNLDASSLVEESFLDLAVMANGSELTVTPQDSGQHAANIVTWSLPDCERDEKLEVFLTNIVVQNVKIKEFNHRTFKMKLLEALKTFHNQFLKDMSEYEGSQKQADSETKTATNSTPANGKQQTQMPFDLNVKFLLFYFEIYKRLISRLLSLHNQTLGALLDYFEKNYMPENEYDPRRHQGLMVLDKTNLRIISDTVEDFYSTIAMVVKFLNEKLLEMLNFFPIESMTIPQFYKLEAFIDRVRKCFEEQLKISTAVSSWLVTDNQTLITAINRVKSTYMDKISITPLMDLKLKFERAFLEVFNKQSVLSLKKQLEEESWQPADIPYSYMTFFNLFFDPSHDLKGPEPEPIENGEEILKQKSIANQNQDSDNEEESKLPSNGQPKHKLSPLEESGYIKIMKSDLIIDEKRYKLTSSVLLLVQIICDYLHLGYRFKGISMDCLLKTIEILKFYNTMATKLILNAGVVQFKIIKTITAKILGLSALCLSFLKMLMEPMQYLVEKKFNINKEVARTQILNVKSELRNHVNEIKMKIVTILRDRINQSCATIAKLEWTNQTTTITIPTKLTIEIINNTRTMSKNIEEFFLSEDLYEIFSKVFEYFKTNYLKTFNELEIESRLVAQRVKEELEYFLQDLKSLKVTSIVPIDDIETAVKGIIGNRCDPYLEITSIH